MTTQFVAGEFLRSIREETHDPPIGDEAKEIFPVWKRIPWASRRCSQSTNSIKKLPLIASAG